ncbi:hypothetical protein ACTOB_004437 [Actinoplanes oblitus]|uniref:Uncharacterized protein n=1 Tax=Actinoplanes oblitus TaxID=3040509 RepID=A0ABY8W6B0_9ACTN|nr:hypothetical protein [Actinoplanes oblitus]WIM92495.1 hypothetical protein ACTOB_004437 [Actinoplanes oblitus]
MSLHYEIVVSCFLDDRTPEHVLEALRWHLGLIEERPDHLHRERSPFPLWIPDPSSYLPGGEVARLQRQRRGFTPGGDVYGWGLYARTLCLDDALGEALALLEFVAPHVSDEGYGGHMREEFDTDEVSVFVFKNGSFDVHR